MSQPPKTSRARRAAPEIRQADILDAALAEFASHGFEGARVEDIARHAQVSKGTVYLYYPTKQALFEALVRRDIAPRVAAAVGILKDYNGPIEPVLMGVAQMASAAIRDGRLPIYPKLLIAEAGRFPDLAVFYRREVVGQMLGALTGLFERALLRGEISGVTAEMAAHLAIAPVLKAMLWELVFGKIDDEPFPPEPYLKAHIQVFLRGLNYKESSNA
ncbi:MULTISPECIES: TetR/AcrR family transcriptional regulator [Asticcacaulis]|uniref:TetR/AcrR family transcriptional regulator n=1 Tax=Asticcacaulis TaxID=76890 RepID=UPI001AE7EAB5|nr:MULTISPECIES: TetR/AcrR family transcriptional regulator [Asticcacaulis]MBP2161381.1 AcrR family transcriptional regulator [Asticcacaulis solisilvae]MDR6802426.1 AcrR family transcriptional regulator [Asticcacaulis sp. BE141]